MRDSPKVRLCKAIRDRIYDKEQFGFSILKREVIQLLSPESTIVDIGCGRKAKFLRSLSARVNEAYGIDLDVSETAIEGNIRIMYGDAEKIPLPDLSMDVVTMIHVSEHLRNPKRVFLECKRVLKPGGSLFLIAPCKFYPPTIGGRILPYCLRKRINMIVTSTDREDTFPAYYKANSHYALNRIGSSVGLNVVSMKYLLYHPEYAMFSKVFYRCVVSIERAILTRELFKYFRHQIFCHLKNPDEL